MHIYLCIYSITIKIKLYHSVELLEIINKNY